MNNNLVSINNKMGTVKYGANVCETVAFVAELIANDSLNKELSKSGDSVNNKELIASIILGMLVKHTEYTEFDKLMNRLDSRA